MRPGGDPLTAPDWSTVLVRLSCLAVSSMSTVLRLMPVSGTEKDIEILGLRHQFTILQRRPSGPAGTPAW